MLLTQKAANSGGGAEAESSQADSDQGEEATGLPKSSPELANPALTTTGSRAAVLKSPTVKPAVTASGASRPLRRQGVKGITEALSIGP